MDNVGFTSECQVRALALDLGKHDRSTVHLTGSAAGKVQLPQTGRSLQGAVLFRVGHPKSLFMRSARVLRDFSALLECSWAG